MSVFGLGVPDWDWGVALVLLGSLSAVLGVLYALTESDPKRLSRVEEVSAYFPSEVRYRAEIEPTFERFVCGPLTRGGLGAVERMKVIQAGSLRAYLAYVPFPGIALLLWLGGSR